MYNPIIRIYANNNAIEQCTSTCLDHFCLIYVVKQVVLVPSISMNLNRNISTIQLALRHDIYLIELKPKHTNNTASFASCPELHTEKLTVRVV